MHQLHLKSVTILLALEAVAIAEPEGIWNPAEPECWNARANGNYTFWT